jgi:hypothetical protein
LQEIHLVFRQNSLHKVRATLEKAPRVDLNQRIDGKICGKVLLKAAASHGHIAYPIIRLLQEFGADIHLLNSRQYNGLYKYFIKKGNEETLSLFESNLQASFDSSAVAGTSPSASNIGVCLKKAEKNFQTSRKLLSVEELFQMSLEQRRDYLSPLDSIYNYGASQQDLESYDDPKYLPFMLGMKLGDWRRGIIS